MHEFLLLYMKKANIYQSLVGSMLIDVRLTLLLMTIDVGLDREDHGSIPATTIERGLKPLDVRTNPRTELNR
jgi:hypothetical protein